MFLHDSCVRHDVYLKPENIILLGCATDEQVEDVSLMVTLMMCSVVFPATRNAMLASTVAALAVFAVMLVAVVSGVKFKEAEGASKYEVHTAAFQPYLGSRATMSATSRASITSSLNSRALTGCISMGLADAVISDTGEHILDIGKGRRDCSKSRKRNKSHRCDHDE